MTDTLLILSPLRQDSGNLSTVGRIREHLVGEYECLMRDATTINCRELEQVITEHCVSLILALHAYHAGSLLADVSIPFILIFGGTDINECPKDSDKLQTMTCAVKKAKCLVCFSSYMVRQAVFLWPEVDTSKFVIIPQAICTSPSSICLNEVLKNRCDYIANNNSLIFLLVSGIRPVKDPTYILQKFSEWHMSNNQNAILIIVGPVIDKDYAVMFKNTISRCNGVFYMGSFPKEDTHAIMQQSFAVLNTSHSEGMAGSILEAMDLGIPVIARNNPGNASLISHSQTGLLFEKPEECIRQMEELIKKPALRDSIISEAKNAVELHHNCMVEKAAYQDIVKKVLTNTKLIQSKTN